MATASNKESNNSENMTVEEVVINNRRIYILESTAFLAQSVERQPFKLVVVGSSPTEGDYYCSIPSYLFYKTIHRIEWKESLILPLRSKSTRFQKSKETL